MGEAALDDPPGQFVVRVARGAGKAHDTAKRVDADPDQLRVPYSGLAIDGTDQRLVDRGRHIVRDGRR